MHVASYSGHVPSRWQWRWAEEKNDGGSGLGITSMPSKVHRDAPKALRLSIGRRRQMTARSWANVKEASECAVGSPEAARSSISSSTAPSGRACGTDVACSSMEERISGGGHRYIFGRISPATLTECHQRASMAKLTLKKQIQACGVQDGILHVTTLVYWLSVCIILHS